jgi:3-hydroxyisobutyrate dehydrogenase
MSRFYGEKYMNRDYRLDFDLALGYKDLTYAKKLYEDLHVPAFMLDGALDLCNMALQGRTPGEVRDFSYPCQTMHELVEQEKR